MRPLRINRANFIISRNYRDKIKRALARLDRPTRSLARARRFSGFVWKFSLSGRISLDEPYLLDTRD